MKKLIAFALILTFIIALISCATQTPPDATTFNYYTSKITPTIATTATEATTATHIAEMTEATTPQIIGTQVIENKEYPIVGDFTRLHDIEFKGFYIYPPRWRYSDEQPYIGSDYKGTYSNIRADASRDRQPRDILIYTILGYAGEDKVLNAAGDRTKTYYYVHIQRYGEEDNDDNIYTVTELGSCTHPVYGWDRIEIGKKYIVVTFQENYEELHKDTPFNFARHFLLEEIDGVEWVYHDLDSDFSKFLAKTEITDEYEKQIYKPGIDDDIISYIKANKMELPTREYKVELYEFVREMCLIPKQPPQS